VDDSFLAAADSIISGTAALERLREGNRRFATNTCRIGRLATQERREELIAGQHPFAIILGCSDSRAPAEILFDQGLGDLFVIRVAGNIVAPSQVGSVEFAAERFGTRLVVVMGHSSCGAVAATIEAVKHPGGSASQNVRSIVERIRPAVEPLVQTALEGAALERAAIRANVLAAANHLRNGSVILERLIREHELLVVGAEYDLESGVVDFFDGVPR
jgi:carbonic anhydrase